MSPRTDSLRTRDALLDAAERLIAERGLHGVSLRAINAAAGARNVSAIHYHFGSKDAVVAGAVARRMDRLAQERLAALDALRTDADGPPQLRSIVEAVVAPFLRMLVDPGGAEPVTFLARVAADPGVSLEQHAGPAFWRMIERLATLLGHALPALPDRIVLLRVRFLVQQCFVLVTELQRLAGVPGSPERRREVSVIGADLVDYLVGGLAADTRVGAEHRTAVAPGKRSPALATGGRRRRAVANRNRAARGLARRDRP